MIPDAIGMTGLLMLLIGYYLLSKGIFHSDKKLYYLVNCFGSSFLLISLYYTPNIPSIVMQVAFVTISIYGLKRAKKWT